jgi:hypothetical protein
VFELIRPGTTYDFIGKWRVCVIGSLVLIAMGLAAIPLRGGIRWGVDFAGGTEMLVHFDAAADVSEGKVRDVVQSVGVEPSVVRFGRPVSPVPDPLPGHGGTGRRAEPGRGSDPCCARAGRREAHGRSCGVRRAQGRRGAAPRRHQGHADRVRTDPDLHGVPLHAPVRAGRRDRADPRRARDGCDLAADGTAVRSAGARRAARSSATASTTRS